jgi:hypothetical protein
LPASADSRVRWLATAFFPITLPEGIPATQPEIWIGTIEISFTDPEAPAGVKPEPAFTVVTTWASSSEEYGQKCKRMLESYGWNLLGVDWAGVPEDREFSKQVEDMLERTRNNPKAIIYGTFYSYPMM